jgi:hypothetical protein
MNARCSDCGRPFRRKPDEQWKTRCISCWRAHKGFTERYAVTGAQAELPQRLRALTQLCHPDRHGNSALANAVTAWLLRVREELRT